MFVLVFGLQNAWTVNWTVNKMRLRVMLCVWVIFLSLVNLLSGIVAAASIIELEEIASGFEDPITVVNAGDGSGRLFVVEKAGRIMVIKDGVVLDNPFLDIRARVVEVGQETGLLGLAFHPNYEDNGRFFLNYTTIDADVDASGLADGRRDSGLMGAESKVVDHFETEVVELRVSRINPDIARIGERLVLEVNQPTNIHNGGQLQFGHDGFLYIGMGDGGPADDGFGNGQDRDTRLGAVLRVDVLSDGRVVAPLGNPFVGIDGVDSIFAYGFRNPWRFSFDRLDGRLFLGDVGQRRFEEVNIVTNGGNYGWSIMEGRHCFPESVEECSRTGLILPVAEYGRDDGQAIIGGYVYRGGAIPELFGAYLFGDFVSGKIWSLVEVSADEWERTELMETGFPISSFGEDEGGELYVVDFTGSVHKIIPDGASNGRMADAEPPEIPVVNPEPAAVVFEVNCDEDFSKGAAGVEWLVLAPGDSVACVLELVGVDPGEPVDVSTFLIGGFSSAIGVDPAGGVIDENGRFAFDITAVKRGVDWMALSVGNKDGGFAFDGGAVGAGVSAGIFVLVK